MKRREFLSIPATALGGTLLYTLAGEPFHLHAQNGQVKVPLRFFAVEHFGQPGRPKPPEPGTDHGPEADALGGREGLG